MIDVKAIYFLFTKSIFCLFLNFIQRGNGYFRGFLRNNVSEISNIGLKLVSTVLLIHVKILFKFMTITFGICFPAFLLESIFCVHRIDSREEEKNEEEESPTDR